jgi:hypothetical protein
MEQLRAHLSTLQSQQLPNLIETFILPHPIDQNLSDIENAEKIKRHSFAQTILAQNIVTTFSIFREIDRECFV